MLNQKYGVVYTPDSLAEFVATLLYRFSDINEEKQALVLDPASGECSLLRAAKNLFGEYNRYIGIDVDQDATERTGREFEIIHNDAVLPQNVKRATADYWREKLNSVDLIIANPPWSSEKVYERRRLADAGFTLISGQYDSYVLFIELAYKVLCDRGAMTFIIPDSLFDAQNESLRRFLVKKKTQIKVIARLGEKIFDEVNRATTVIVCKKDMSDENSITECFRLSTDNRKAYLAGNGTLLSFYKREMHTVRQSRFAQNGAYHFDIDTHENEEKLIQKISSDSIDWEKDFVFGRGVEISKSGEIVYCPHCGKAQGYSKKHIDAGTIVSGKSMFVVLCLAIGTILGELIGIENGFEKFGEWLKKKTGNSGDKQFVEAFVTASLTVCIGAMAIVGAIQDGILGDCSTLAVKSVLDFIIIAVMTSSLGKGCAFSTIPVLAFEGSITILAKLVSPIMTDLAITYISLIGSILIFCVGVNLVWGKTIRVANMLPAVVFAVISAYIPWEL